MKLTALLLPLLIAACAGNQKPDEGESVIYAEQDKTGVYKFCKEKDCPEWRRKTLPRVQPKLIEQQPQIDPPVEVEKVIETVESRPVVKPTTKKGGGKKHKQSSKKPSKKPICK